MKEDKAILCYTYLTGEPVFLKSLSIEELKKDEILSLLHDHKILHLILPSKKQEKVAEGKEKMVYCFTYINEEPVLVKIIKLSELTGEFIFEMLQKYGNIYLYLLKTL